ncbi:MAG: ATP-binding cassette domain-containing protein [Alphaproteobacteria bacterium]
MSDPSLTATGLALREITITLRQTRLLTIDAHVAPGDVLTVMGASGSGKSTLLSFVAGFLDPVFSASGSVLLDGVDLTILPAEQRRFGLLFQDPLLFPHLSVGGNLLFGLSADIRGRPARLAAVNEALAEVDLAGFAGRDPATLSGGQRARVALVRTLLSRPRALLLDEPFSKLDVSMKDQIRALVFERARARGLPVLLVTHDPDDARAAGGQTIDLSPPCP